MPDLAFLRKILNVVGSVPKYEDHYTRLEKLEPGTLLWGQGIWRSNVGDDFEHRCGTVMCVAGWAGHLDPEVHYDDIAGLGSRNHIFTDAHEDLGHVADWAEARLGLSELEAVRLFAGGNTLEDLEMRYRDLCVDNGVTPEPPNPTPPERSHPMTATHTDIIYSVIDDVTAWLEPKLRSQLAIATAATDTMDNDRDTVFRILGPAMEAVPDSVGVYLSWCSPAAAVVRHEARLHQLVLIRTLRATLGDETARTETVIVIQSLIETFPEYADTDAEHDMAMKLTERFRDALDDHIHATRRGTSDPLGGVGEGM